MNKHIGWWWLIFCAGYQNIVRINTSKKKISYKVRYKLTIFLKQRLLKKCLRHATDTSMKVEACLTGEQCASDMKGTHCRPLCGNVGKPGDWAPINMDYTAIDELREFSFSFCLAISVFLMVGCNFMQNKLS